MARGLIRRAGRYEFRGYLTWPGDFHVVHVGRFACRFNHGFTWQTWMLLELRIFGYGCNIFLARHE